MQCLDSRIDQKHVKTQKMFLCMLERWKNLKTTNSNLLSRAIILATHPPLNRDFLRCTIKAREAKYAGRVTSILHLCSKAFALPCVHHIDPLNWDLLSI